MAYFNKKFSKQIKVKTLKPNELYTQNTILSINKENEQTEETLEDILLEHIDLSGKT